MRVRAREECETVDCSVLALELPLATLSRWQQLVELSLHGGEDLAELLLSKRDAVAVEVGAGNGHVLDPLGSCPGKSEEPLSLVKLGEST